MKKLNKCKKGFFARLMALTIIAAVMFTDGTVVKAAEPVTGPTIEVIGDLEIVIKRGSNYVDDGCKVMNEKGQEIPELTSKVVTKYYELKQIEGKWQEVLLNPFDTKRIAKVKVRYYLEEKGIEGVRDLDIVDQFDPEYDRWIKGQIAAQEAHRNAEKQKGIVAASGNGDKKPSGSSSGSGGGGSTGGGTTPKPNPRPNPTPGPGDDTGGDNPTPSPSPSPTPGPGDDTGGDNPSSDPGPSPTPGAGDDTGGDNPI